MSEIRNKTVHIAFSEKELSKIDKYCKYEDIKLTTRTEFIRQAIFDKIRNIEYPKKTTSSVSNPKVIDQMIKNQTLMLEEMKLMKAKLTTINGIKNGYKSLKELMSEGTYKENLKLKTERIQGIMLDNPKGYTPKQLEVITKFDAKSINLALESNLKIFRNNMNGRWVLHE